MSDGPASTAGGGAPPAAASPPKAPAAGGGAGGGDIRIERLRLRVAGLDEDAACMLAKLVAQGLTPDLFRPIGSAGLDSLKVEVKGGGAASPGGQRAEKPDQLADRIVDAVGRTLARDRVSTSPEGVLPA